MQKVAFNQKFKKVNHTKIKSRTIVKYRKLKKIYKFDVKIAQINGIKIKLNPTSPRSDCQREMKKISSFRT